MRPSYRTVLIACFSAAAASEHVQSAEHVQFRNDGNQTVNVITESGGGTTTKSFVLPPRGKHMLNIGGGTLLWCSYHDGEPQCKPDKEVVAGKVVSVR